MPDNQPPPLNLVNIERATTTVSYASLGDEISRLSADGWSDFKTDRRGDQVTITAEREAQPVPAAATGRPPSATVGAKLRDARKAAGLTGRQVAAVALMAPTFLSDVENERREPDMETVWRLALAIGVNPAEYDDRLATVAHGEFEGWLEDMARRQAEKAGARKGKPGKKL